MELTYTKHSDYYLPDLNIPAKEKALVNRYGRMHGNYLKKNNQTAYNELLFSGRLNQYLAELGEQAEKMLALLTEQYAVAENITEEMKAADQMGWIRFTLTPVLLSIPPLLTVTALVPWLCYRKMTSITIVERL